MLRRITTLMLLAITLGSCSYSYDVIALIHDGRVVFAVDPASAQQPSCLRRIEVIAKNAPDPIWLESVSYDDECDNKFPIPYGTTLKGLHQQDRKMVLAKPLGRNVIYYVSITTDATGYGSGQFMVRADGRVENLLYKKTVPQKNASFAAP